MQLKLAVGFHLEQSKLDSPSTYPECPCEETGRCGQQTTESTTHPGFCSDPSGRSEQKGWC